MFVAQFGSEETFVCLNDETVSDESCSGFWTLVFDPEPDHGFACVSDVKR